MADSQRASGGTASRRYYLANLAECQARAKAQRQTKAWKDWHKEYKKRKRAERALHDAHIKAWKLWARQLRAEARAARPAPLSAAEKFRQRYERDPAFREKQKERTRKRKETVPLYYANQMLGGTKDRKYPESLLLAKQLELRIAKQLREKA